MSENKLKQKWEKITKNLLKTDSLFINSVVIAGVEELLGASLKTALDVETNLKYTMNELNNLKTGKFSCLFDKLHFYYL